MKDMPTFHKGLLKNYQVVNVPGVYIVSVASTVTVNNLITDDYPRYLIPLRLTTGEGLLQLMDILDKVEQVPFPMVRDCFITGAIFEKDISDDELPVKGEQVIVTIDKVDDNFRCTNIELLPRTELEYVDVDALCKFRSNIKNLIK